MRLQGEYIHKSLYIVERKRKVTRERIRIRNIEPKKKKKKKKQHKEILNDEATGENQQWMMMITRKTARQKFEKKWKGDGMRQELHRE